MNCEGFGRWLDEGLAEATGAEHRAHAATCARCARELRAIEEIEGLLASTPTPAPAGFTERTMARIATSSAALGRVPSPPPSPMAWWVRAASQPASALAATLAALMLWQRQALQAFAVHAVHALTPAMPPGPELSLGPAFQRPDVVLGLMLVMIPASAWLASALFRASERMVSARMAAARTPRRG